MAKQRCKIRQKERKRGRLTTKRILTTRITSIINKQQNETKDKTNERRIIMLKVCCKIPSRTRHNDIGMVCGCFASLFVGVLWMSEQLLCHNLSMSASHDSQISLRINARDVPKTQSLCHFSEHDLKVSNRQT